MDLVDDENNEEAGFTQEECVGWVEEEADLRQMARSPHDSLLSSSFLATTQSSRKKEHTVEHRETPPADLVKKLDPNYSPKQEIDQLLKTTASIEENASTQPHDNKSTQATAAPLGMRHRRRQREQTVTAKKPPVKKQKRPTSRGGGRRRPRSSGDFSTESLLPSANKQQQGSSPQGMDSGAFESLLRELDRPPQRAPLHPAKVNMSQRGASRGSDKNTPASTRPVSASIPIPATRTTNKAPERTLTQNTSMNPYLARSVVPNKPPNSSVATQKVHNTHPAKATNPASTVAATTRPVQRQPSAPKPHGTYPPKAPAHVGPRLDSAMGENKVQNKQLTETSSVACNAQERASDAPSTKQELVDPQSESSLLDDLQFSEEDWAALMTSAESRCPPDATKETVKPTSDKGAVTKQSHSTTDWNAIQALDESLARERGITTNNEDEFGDLPIMDFDDLDRKIAQRASASTNDVVSKPKAPPPNAAVRNPVASTYDPQHSFIAFSRYKVVRTEVDNTTYTKSVFVKKWSADMLNDRQRQSIHQLATLERSGSLTKEDKTSDGCIFLRGEWYHTHVDAGEIVHLCSLSGRYRTDAGALPVVLHTNPPQGSNADDDLVLIVHPDRLIPPTVISETVSCSRRAVLRMRLGSSGISNKAPLFGTLRHDLFEKCMSSQDFSWPTAKKFARAIVRQNADSLVGCGITDAEAREEVLRVVPQIQQFAANYTSFKGAKLRNQQRPLVGSRLEGNGIQPDMHFVANSVQATEESIVCPELGLKGSLDVTVSATTTTLPSTASSNQIGQSQNSLVSIELKTGHNKTPANEHMAQLALYTVMLRVRRGTHNPSPSLSQPASQEITAAGESGMLLYLNHERYLATHVSPMANETKSLIGQRNLVASELSRASTPRGIALNYEEENNIEAAKGPGPENQRGPSINLLPAPPAALPEVLAASDSCARCYMKRECMTYAAAELKMALSTSIQGVGKSHAKLLQRFTGHLSQQDLSYFQEWDRLIDLEADASTHMTTTAWLHSSEEHEKATGKCMSSMVLDEMETMMANADSVNDPHTAFIVMVRSKDSVLTTPLSRLNIESGSHAVISSDATSLHLSSDHPAPARNVGTKGRHFRHRMSVVRGFVHSVDEKRLTIRSSRDELNQLSRLNQTWNETRHVSQCASSQADGLLHFRVDKDDASTGIGTLRQNLIRLLTSDVRNMEEEEIKARMTQQLVADASSPRRDRVPWLRDVIIRLRPPIFDEESRASMFNDRGNNRSPASRASGSDFMSLATEFSELNSDQRKAVEKIMCAKDYALIQGLPGTGKTSTIAFVARLLAAHGKRVLITSYTHAAIDNLMIKLIESGFSSEMGNNSSPPLVRIGNKSSCHPRVHSILVSNIAASKEINSDDRNGSVGDLPSPDSLSHVLSAAQIVGVSALTVPRSPLLVGQHFDVVIVDEAGQISQPAILGALLAADSFVLVGDHMQLPPLVNSEVAENGGYNVSMLKRLADAHPSAVAQLALQYRMHGAICQLSNDIVYGGKLKCANEEVEKQLLRLPCFPSGVLKNVLDGAATCWMTEVLNPSRPVVFVDTDSIRSDTATKGSFRMATPPSQDEAINSVTFGLERATGKRGKGNVVNDTEALLVRQLVHGFLECGLTTFQVGVICPFRSQLRLLNQNKTVEEWKSKGLELSTIDRYQGRDKPAIIISFVRSNANGNSGRLLEDFRRLNVAVSRAKRKLIMIGSFSTLHKGSNVLRPVLKNMQQRKQIVKLPGENALQSYKIV